MKAVVGTFKARFGGILLTLVEQPVFSIMTTSMTKRDTSPRQEAIYDCARRHLHPPQMAAEDVNVSF